MSGGGGGGALIEEEHEEHVNHEAWAIPYADMVTLLMALFLMLFAISTLDLQKFQALAANVSEELNSGGEPSVLDGGAGMLGGGGPTADIAVPTIVAPPITKGEQALAREEQRAAAQRSEQRNLDAVEERIAEHAADVGLTDSIGFRREVRGLVVTIVTDNVLFDPGGGNLRPAGLDVLREVASPLVDMPNEIAIEGHTDVRPINTAQFPSNWELSTQRATSVLRYLVDTMGLDPARVSASGYGAERPIAEGDSPEALTANRRVEIAILSEVPADPG